MNRFNEKKLTNKKFRRTEEAIVSALVNSRREITQSKLLKLANISRSTLYRHHLNFHNIGSDYEKFLIRSHRTLIKRLINNGTTLPNIYYRTIAFLEKNRNIVTLVIRYGNRNFIETLLKNLQPAVIKSAKIKNDKVFTIYIKEVSGLIEGWVNSGFPRDGIEPLLSQISYLTKTANQHLSPISDLA